MRVAGSLISKEGQLVPPESGVLQDFGDTAKRSERGVRNKGKGGNYLE